MSNGKPNSKNPQFLYNEHEIRVNEVESLARIFQEFKSGFDFLKKYPRSVSIFGSARCSADGAWAAKAEDLAGRIVHDLKYAVITGGGGGIMSAANKGAHQAGGSSLGITIRLPHEQVTNPYVDHQMICRYFFTRKAILTFAAESYIFFPGGFGTMDELFEVLTLIQTDKIPRVPIFLFGSDFWNPWLDFMKKKMADEYETIGQEDLKLFTITDDADVVINAIKQAPVSRWWKDIEQS